MKTVALALTGLIVLAISATAQDSFKPDAEGFIRDWLILAPLPSSEQGAEGLNHDYLNGEANIRPKAGTQITNGGVTLTWQAHHTPAYFIDFRESFDKTGGEHVAGYAVAYVIADAPMSVTLALGTNDQGKAWLNGKEVFTFLETRVLERDADKVPVSLQQGQNVLVLKVVNEVNSWQACARFLQGNLAVTNLKIALTPQ